MRNMVYALLKEKHILGNECRISYGIVVYSCAGADGTSTIVASVHDITSNKETLANLVDNCNRLKLSIVHLSDIVEDFLAN